jgi:hypothetical protein
VTITGVHETAAIACTGEVGPGVLSLYFEGGGSEEGVWGGEGGVCALDEDVCRVLRGAGGDLLRDERPKGKAFCTRCIYNCPTGQGSIAVRAGE